MAQPLPFERSGHRDDGRRQSVLSSLIPGSLSLPPTFLATSPVVREILHRDVDECSTDDEDSPDHESHDIPEHDARLAFHPNGVAFGCGYSMVPMLGLDMPVSNPHEVDESLGAELALLQDNDCVPSSRRPSVAVPDESTRLLDVEEQATPAAPPPDELRAIWDEAVAAGRIKTSWQREAKTLVGYSLPLIATFVLHYSVTIGSVLTVGRLGMLELAAVNRVSPTPLPTPPPSPFLILRPSNILTRDSRDHDSKYYMLRARSRPLDDA